MSVAIYTGYGLVGAGSRSSFDAHYACHDQRDFEAVIACGQTSRKGISIADFGCGSGLSTLSIGRSMDRTSRICAIDQVEGLLSQVTQKFATHLADLAHALTTGKADVSSLSSLTNAVGPAKFDVIIAYWVAQDIPNFPRVMHMWAANFLAPNGYIVVDVRHPNMNLGTLDVWRGPPGSPETLPNWVPFSSERLPAWVPKPLPFPSVLPSRLYFAQQNTRDECHNRAVRLAQEANLLLELYPIDPFNPANPMNTSSRTEDIPPYYSVDPRWVVGLTKAYAAHVNNEIYDENAAMTALVRALLEDWGSQGIGRPDTSLRSLHKNACVVVRYRYPGPVVNGRCPICPNREFADCHGRFNKEKVPGGQAKDLLT